MQNIILLHGALGTSADLVQLQQKLSSDFKVHTFTFSGHGHQKFESQFGIGQFSRELENFILKNELAGSCIFGYSMGGYAALKLAANNPELIKSIVTYATKFAWTEETIAREIKMCDPDKILEKAPAFAKSLQQKHSDWKGLLGQCARMIENFGKEDLLSFDVLKQIKCPVLITVGDQDKMVSIEESQKVCFTLNNAALRIVEGCKHPLETVDPKLLAQLIKDQCLKN